MMKMLLSVISAALLTASCSKEDRNAAPPSAAAKDPSLRQAAGDAAAGKAVYERHCHYCHGMKGYGDGAVGIALTPHPVNFVDDSKRMGKSDAELLKSITEGIRKEIGGESMTMPRWKEILSEKERWDVLAYVRKLSEGGNPPEDGRKKDTRGRTPDGK